MRLVGYACDKISGEEFEINTASPRGACRVSPAGKAERPNRPPGEHYVQKVRLEALGGKLVASDNEFCRDGRWAPTLLGAYPVRG